MKLTLAEIDQPYSDATVRTYRPEAVLCELEDGSRIPAQYFSLVEAPRAAEINPEYAQRLLDLAVRVGLPSDYVDRIHCQKPKAKSLS